MTTDNRAASYKKYKQSPKGKARDRRYERSERGKTMRRRQYRVYDKSEHGHAYRRAYNLKKAFGLTQDQYDKLLAQQEGKCAICGNTPKTRRLSVDHDHGPSKRVRCLACFTCNRYRIGTNTVETARRVVAILESDFDGRNL
jgi:hypothetical protein